MQKGENFSFFAPLSLNDKISFAVTLMLSRGWISRIHSSLQREEKVFTGQIFAQQIFGSFAPRQTEKKNICKQRQQIQPRN